MCLRSPALALGVNSSLQPKRSRPMPSGRNEKVEELIRTAEARIETGRYAEADAALIEAVNLQQDHARLWYTSAFPARKPVAATTPSENTRPRASTIRRCTRPG